MSEAFRAEQREQQIGQQQQADHESDGVEEAHEGSRGRSHSAIKPSDRTNMMNARPSQKMSMGRDSFRSYLTAEDRKARIRKRAGGIKIASRGLRPAAALPSASSPPPRAGSMLNA